MRRNRLGLEEKEYVEHEQPLYSRLMIGGDNSGVPVFFGNHVGQYNRQGELMDRADTNMDNSSMCCNMFLVKGIRFRETIMDRNVREHLLKYAYVIFRIVDRDIFTYPLHLMDNYYYFLEKRFEKPITIDTYMNFMVMLHMKDYERRFQLTCELLGVMRRPN